MIALVAEALPQVSDPTAMILAGAAACISALASILLAIIGSLVKGVKEELRSLRQAITGDGGMTIGLVTRITGVEGELKTAKADIESLKRGTLTREIFERETEAQNRRLEELKEDGHVLTAKVDKLDRNVASRPWSQASMQAVRPHEPPPSDPPQPPRPKLPSRPR